MKNQTFGISNKIARHGFGVSLLRAMIQRLSDGNLRQEEFKKWRWASFDDFDACIRYKENRSNGTDSDSPPRSFPNDGIYTWDSPSKTYNPITGSNVRYTEGPGDKAWMEERDRNYLTRLEREGRLQELEPEIWRQRHPGEGVARLQRENQVLCHQVQQPAISISQSFFPPISQEATQQSVTVGSAAEVSASTERLSNVNLRRLTTESDHINLLVSAFSSASRNILITSFGINYKTFQVADLFHLIPMARSRGVMIYIYWNDQHDIERGLCDFLQRNGVRLDQAFTHSKILAVDDNLIAIGSFNWLSGIDDRYPDNSNGSIVCCGDICTELKQELWKHIKHYRDLQFGRFWQAEKFERNPDNSSSLEYKIKENSTLTYIPSLEQHQLFLQKIFTTAQHRIIICSPFISYNGVFAEDIHPGLLRQTAQRGVEIFFICLHDAPSLPKFREFLKLAHSPNIHLIPAAGFHLKTVIVDNQTITEGSFNWLSAVRDSTSDSHNHEVTLVVDGHMAKELIAHFYRSKLGLGIPRAVEYLRWHADSEDGNSSRHERNKRSRTEEEANSSAHVPSRTQ